MLTSHSTEIAGLTDGFKLVIEFIRVGNKENLQTQNPRVEKSGTGNPGRRY